MLVRALGARSDRSATPAKRDAQTLESELLDDDHDGLATECDINRATRLCELTRSRA
jgi:hypothetical protein